MAENQSNPAVVRVRFDPTYLICNISGYLKIFEILLNIVGLSLIQASGDFAKTSRCEFYTFVSAAGICVTSVLLIFYLYHIIEKIKIPWLKIELGFCAVWTLFYLIAGLLTIGLVNGYLDQAGYVALAAMTCYGLETCHKIWTILRGHPAQ